METKYKLNKNNNNIEKTIFIETVQKKIEKYSPINTSMILPENETKLKPDDNGLLITSTKNKNNNLEKNIKNKNTLLLHLSKKNSFVLILYNNFYYNL